MPDHPGYDHEPTRRLSRAPLLITIGVLVAVVIGVVAILTGRPDPAPDPSVGAAPTPVVSVTARVTVTPSVTPSPSLSSVVGDDAVELVPSAAAGSTVRTFLDGWLATDPVRRAWLLGRSATPELAGELELTDPDAIPAGPVVSVEAVGGSEFSAEYVAELASVSVWVIAVADPEASTGWAVVSIEPEN